MIHEYNLSFATITKCIVKLHSHSTFQAKKITTVDQQCKLNE